MKIGVVSDIHAYLSPLERALTLFDAMGVDTIVCAGDIVDGREDGDAVVSALMARGIACVQGNHDRDTFSDQADLRRRMRAAGETRHAFLLQSQTVAYVMALPLARYFWWSGLSVCLAHGTPMQQTRYLFADSDATKFHRMMAEAQTDVVILGHSHQPMAVQVGHGWAFNPGSVYENRFDETQTCAVLTLPDCTFEVFNLATLAPYPLTVRVI